MLSIVGDSYGLWLCNDDKLSCGFSQIFEGYNLSFGLPFFRAVFFICGFSYLVLDLVVPMFHYLIYARLIFFLKKRYETCEHA